MNHALRRISIAALAMFLLLMLSVNYLQVFRASSLAAEPDNARIFDQQFKVWRGEIVAAGGGQQVVVAESRKQSDGDFKRYYPYGPVYAPVTGYDSIYAETSPYGATGIEKSQDSLLAGTSPKLDVDNLRGLFTGKPKQGASVYLTISAKAQEAAYQALAAFGKPAAAVAIDPSTGAILALASYPSFNPNLLTTLSSTQLNKNDSALEKDPAQPLLNRATNDLFPPGSTFKIITSSTAFSTGKVANQNSTIPAPQFYHLPGSTHVLTNDGDAPCGNGKPSIIYAFTLSCNTAFGKLGATLGGSALHKYANLFGFNGNWNQDVGLPVSASVYGNSKGQPLTDPAQTAISAIGQFDDLVSPMQEAMMAATVANHGKLMQPYLVSYVKAPDQSTVESTVPTAIRQVISPQVATYLKSMMYSVTHNPAGTAYLTAGPPATNIPIAGKTGTAQNGPNNSGLDDAVFTCFAPSSNPQIAVGVIVKGGGFGAAAAAPIAVKIIQAYLGQH
jgi:penicillin-binding protein A